MQHQSLHVFQAAHVRDVGDGVAGQVQVLQVHVLVEVLDSLDVVVGEAEPGEEVDVLEPLYRDNVILGQVQHFQVVKFTNLEHPD